jgi:hypothetical protein
MNDTVIVATDLGTFKAYRLQHTDRDTPRLEVVEEVEFVDGHGKLGDKQTDQAGRYKVPTQDMAMSCGERQKIELELRRRLVKQAAAQLRNVVANRKVETCYFAASSEINDQILDEAGPDVRRKIEKNVGCNLTNSTKNELIRHFLEPETTQA